jgi:glutathione S-transferase
MVAFADTLSKLVSQPTSPNIIMKLYYSPGACSLSPHIALREAGLEVELIKVDPATRRLEDGTDFLTINPRGYVPILVLDDGQQLSEGPAIVQYIADRAPAAQLAPAAGSFERTRLQEWLGFINSELHQNFGLLFNPALHASTRDTVVRKLRARLDWVSEQIQGKRFALGEQFSVADGYLFAVLGWTRFFGMNLADWPVLAEHSGRVASRPAVQAAMRAEGLMA